MLAKMPAIYMNYLEFLVENVAILTDKETGLKEYSIICLRSFSIDMKKEGREGWREESGEREEEWKGVCIIVTLLIFFFAP